MLKKALLRDGDQIQNEISLFFFISTRGTYAAVLPVFAQNESLLHMTCA